MLRPVRWKVAVSGLIGLMEVATSLTFVWMSKRVVDIATGEIQKPLMTWVLVLLGVMFLQVVLRVAARYWEGLVVVKTQNSIRAGVFGDVMSSTWNGRERYHSGDTVNRLEEDIRVVCDFICVTVPDFFITVMQLIAASVFLFALSPSLAWILLLIMPVAVVGSRLFFRKMRKLTGEIRAVDSRIQGHMQENLQHRVLVKTLVGTPRVLSRLSDMQEDVCSKTVRRLRYGAVSRSFLQLGFASGYALVFLWGVFGLRDGTLGYGTMVAFLQLVGQVQRPVANIASQIPAFIRALSSEERLLELLEMPAEQDGEPIALSGVPGVRLEGLCFSYEGAQGKVINSLDFDFRPGTMTAILGPTGVGKSTLVRIIVALLSPDSGKVVLYSEDGKEVESCVRTRCNFMYVPQGNSLMSGTIRENLLMAKADASEEELREALHLAAADFVHDLPDGLDSTCAEVGSGLSEGQAQRISIARALLRPGGILVLDEATSALDAETEQNLLQRIADRYKGTKTILCITHRPAATSYADAVLTLS